MSDNQTSHLLSADSERSEPHPLHPPSGRVERSEGRAFPPDSFLISVVMPCLNESRTLAACITEARAGCEAAHISRRALAHGSDISRSALAPGSDISRSALAPGSLHYEILIADNGSTDGSQEIAIAHGARVISVDQKGYGSALLGGIAAAQGKYIVMGDCDSSYDFGDIPKLIEKLEEGNDLVLGNRFAGGIEPGAMPWHHRYVGNPILSGLGRLLYRTSCRDWHCGLRAFDREKINSLQLKSTGMEFASEMVIRASQAKLQMAEVPTTLRPDGRDRPPHLRSFRDGLRHLAVLYRLSYGTSAMGRVTLGLFVILIGSFFAFTSLHSSIFTTRGVHTGLLEGNFFKDFGSVVDGTTVKHSFPIQVVGTEPIVITNIRTSCQCMFFTSDDLIGKKFSPGSQFTVELGMHVGEAINEHIAVASLEYVSDNHQYVASLRISATIPADYRLSDEELALGTLSEADRERNFEVHIINDSTAISPVIIEDVSTVDSRVTFEFIKGGDKISVRYVQPNADREENINIPIVLTTTSKLKTRSVAYLRGKYEPSVVLRPASILIGSNVMGDHFQTTIELHIAQPADVEVESSVQRLCNVRQVRELEWLIDVNIDLTQAESVMNLPIKIRLADGTFVVKSVPIVFFRGELK